MSRFDGVEAGAMDELADVGAANADGGDAQL